MLKTDEISNQNFENAIKNFKYHFIKILILTFITAAITIVFLMLTPNRYRAEAKLAPVSGSQSGLSGQLGSIASLAGINLNQLGGEDKTTVALEILRTRYFLIKILRDNDFVVPLMAAEGWDSKNNQMLIDPEKFDTTNKRWVREPKEPYGVIPSDEEIVEEFRKNYTVYQDELTGIVTIRFTSFSPEFSQRIVGKVINGINDTVRENDTKEIQNNIMYLEKKIMEVNNNEIKNSFYSIMQDEIKKLMIANVKAEYIFKTVEPAFAPIRKSSPKRALILVLVTSTSFVLFSMFFILRRRKVV